MGDGPRVVDAAHRLDHHAHGRAFVGAGAIVEETAGKGPDTAAGAPALRRETRRGDGPGRFAGILHQGDDDSLRPGVERLADGGRRILGHPHQDRRARRSDADGGLDAHAVPQSALHVDDDGVSLSRPGQFDDGCRSHRHPQRREGLLPETAAEFHVKPIQNGSPPRLDGGPPRREQFNHKPSATVESDVGSEGDY